MLSSIQDKISKLILNDLGAAYIDDATAVRSTESREELVHVMTDYVGMELKYVDHVLSTEEYRWLTDAGE